MKKICTFAVVFIMLTAVSVSADPAPAYDSYSESYEQYAEKEKPACKIHKDCDMPCGQSENIFKKSGRGIKKGFVKIKDGFVWTGRKVKNGFKRVVGKNPEESPAAEQ